MQFSGKSIHFSINHEATDNQLGRTNLTPISYYIQKLIWKDHAFKYQRKNKVFKIKTRVSPWPLDRQSSQTGYKYY
jgi:hypothetical protein